MFSKQFAQEIIKSWKETRGSVNSAIIEEHIETLLETVFFASLNREEGIPIKLRVGFLQRENIQNSGLNTRNFIMVFKKAVPLTVGTLSKIALAFDPETTLIAVSPSSNSEQPLEIWGTAFADKSLKKGFDSIPIYSPIHSDLVISANSPGLITITKGGDIVGRLIDGKFIRPKPSPFKVAALGGYINKIIQSHSEYRNFGNDYSLQYINFIEYLLLQANKRGNGGTIIWLPEEIAIDEANEIDVGQGIEHSLNGSEMLKTICEYNETNTSSKTESDQYFLNMTKKKVAGYIEYLAQLTNLDGALFINDNLRLLSFGSKIKSKKWKGDVLSGPYWSVTRSEYIDMSKYGTRHNSALNFVGNNPGSVAFVLSQDGTITGLTKAKKDLIFYWKDLLSGLFD